ncbi:cytochrome d ubiquinol oxidase subunit II [Stenotrophomonas maltophilia]|uniref:cytochrome d ubiquinol oxidase subunit II n=1 Tax=Stenotrophomonas maltophilia TaxID=40324 RepID=UPI000F7A0B80|nr:cytochrome d ubiquinol oxidase subunit II [Stenotrophomonas maltophilia]RRU88220.1 cytochrome d ubiquinol oxidase subunit II [Stenotrophomonas maltophilia]
MDSMTWLPIAWFAVISFGVLMYVVLDGFVLGIGILAPFAEDEEQLDVMMNTAAPIWDGNETWLVLGGAGLLAAFPTAYAALLSALYLPVLLLLVSLVFRGVAFEFRFKAHRSKRLWSVAFGLGSLLAAFSQGVILGTVVQGVPMTGDTYAGGPFLWFSPFAMLTGAALVAGYALLGGTWLILKTEGRTHALARRLTRPLVVAVIVAMGLVSSWLPFLDLRLMTRWFSDGNFWWLSPVPLLTLAVAVALWRAEKRPTHDLAPFLLSLSLFVLGYLGLVLGMWPYLLPPALTIWDAAAAVSSLGFSLVGLAVMLPVILGYTAWSYRVFRGKVSASTSYH